MGKQEVLVFRTFQEMPSKIIINVRRERGGRTVPMLGRASNGSESNAPIVTPDAVAAVDQSLYGDVDAEKSSRLLTDVVADCWVLMLMLMLIEVGMG